jgi:SAM-dependent methyltransferase
MNIQYAYDENLWFSYPIKVKEVITNFNAKNICEVGGGANPLLNIDFITSLNLDYSIIDISPEELSKAPSCYKKIVGNIESPKILDAGSFDLIFSCMVAEHIRDPKAFHTNIFKLLKPGGIAFHFFPTLFAFPFLMNLLLPENISDYILGLFSPRDKINHGKFKPFYKWTFGPTAKQIKRFTDIGYSILQYTGFFGSKYYERIPIVNVLHRNYSRFLSNNPNPFLTSYAFIILMKP